MVSKISNINIYLQCPNVVLLSTMLENALQLPFKRHCITGSAKLCTHEWTREGHNFGWTVFQQQQYNVLTIFQCKSFLNNTNLSSISNFYLESYGLSLTLKPKVKLNTRGILSVSLRHDIVLHDCVNLLVKNYGYSFSHWEVMAKNSKISRVWHWTRG